MATAVLLAVWNRRPTGWNVREACARIVWFVAGSDVRANEGNLRL